MDDDDWGLEVKQTPKNNTRGNRGRNSQPPSRKQEENVSTNEPKDELNTSNWLDGIQEDTSLNRGGEKVRGKPSSLNESSFDSSIVKSKPSERETIRTELKPDELEDSWAKQDKKQQPPRQRGTRGDRGDKGSTDGEPPKRGNRGNRQGQDNEGAFKKKSHFEQGQQICSDGSDGWSNREGYNRGRGGRGRGGNGGGYRGGYRNNYNDRQGQQQSAPRGNRQYSEKDNQTDNRSQYNRNEYPRNNNQYRNNNYQRRNNQDNRNFNNDNRFDRPYSSNYTHEPNQDTRNPPPTPTYNQSNYTPPTPPNYSTPNYNPPKQENSFQPPPSGWESSNVCETSFQVIGPDQQPPKQVVIVRDKGVTPMPRGRKTWPEASIHIQKCKMTITYRQINEFACKLLVLPYISTKMEYYPRNIINSSSFDYRKKILEKTAKAEEISKPGAVYLQKAVEVGSFVALAFLKIDVGRLEESLKTGVKQVLRLAQTLERQQLDSIVFPICPQLGNAGWVVRPLLDNLENCRKLREFYVTTNQPPCFIAAVKEFTLKVEQLLNENEIYIN